MLCREVLYEGSRGGNLDWAHQSVVLVPTVLVFFVEFGFLCGAVYASVGVVELAVLHSERAIVGNFDSD